MQPSKPVPEQCPVCGSRNLQSNHLVHNSDVRIPPNFVTYRCQNGHTFFVEGESAAAAQGG